VSRSANRDALRQLIEARFAICSEVDLAERLERAKIAWATANDMASVWDHPQLRSLGRIVETDSPAGPLKSFRPPGNNSDYESAIGDIPALGEHTAAILAELGFQETDIDRFRRTATI
jgi:itaconate CoA-transferase